MAIYPSPSLPLRAISIHSVAQAKSLGIMFHSFHFLTLLNMRKCCQSYLQIVFQICSPCFIPTVINLVLASRTYCWDYCSQLLAGLLLSTYTPCLPFSRQHPGGGLFKGTKHRASLSYLNSPKACCHDESSPRISYHALQGSRDLPASLSKCPFYTLTTNQPPRISPALFLSSPLLSSALFPLSFPPPPPSSLPCLNLSLHHLCASIELS